MIRVQIVFANGLSLTISKPTPRETVAKVEEIMWKHMARIRNINVVARGMEMAEGARMKAYFGEIELDIRINHVMDRDGMEHFDLYEIAKHPRRRQAC